MIRVTNVETVPYTGMKHGYFQAKRRRTRVRFSVLTPARRGQRAILEPYRGRTPEKSLRLLLPTVYEKLVGDRLTPLPFPDKINAHWNEEEQAFILIRGGFNGYEIAVTLEQTPDEVEVDAIEADANGTAHLHGAPLPSLGR